MPDKSVADAVVEKAVDKKPLSIADALEFLEDKLKVSETTKDKIHDTIDRLSDLVEDARGEAQDKTKLVRRRIRSHPGASVAIAAAAGVVIGLLLTSRR